MPSPLGRRSTTLVAAVGCLVFVVSVSLVVIMSSHDKTECLSSSYSQVRSPNFVRDEYTMSGQSTRKFTEIVPDRFDGSIPFRDYWSHFHACWQLNGWNDDEAALVLSVRLSGLALKVLNPKPLDSDGRQRNLTIDELKCRLERRYGSGKLAEWYLAQLQTRKQGSKESIQELGVAIDELIQEAYPEATGKLKECLAVIHFRDSILKKEIRSALYRSRPESLDEAIRYALEAECIMDLEAQRDKDSVQKTEGADGTNDRMDGLEKRERESKELLVKLIETKQSKNRSVNVCRRSRRKSRRQRQCFYCKRFGHIRRRCPELRCKGKPHVNPSRVTRDVNVEHPRNDNHDSSPGNRCRVSVEDSAQVEPVQRSDVIGTSEVKSKIKTVVDKLSSEISEMQNQNNNAWMENVAGEIEAGKMTGAEYQAQGCWSTEQWMTSGTCGVGHTQTKLVGYWCAYFDFTQYQGGLVWCVAWPVYVLKVG